MKNSITETEAAGNMHKFYEAFAIPFAMSQPNNVDLNEILFRPTRQEL